jgi:exodeoxyribonuclease VII large subunit
MAVPVRADLIAELMSKARRALACWRRTQEHRRTELRAATRALPDAQELLAVPRQRLDACAERLPRALRANAQIHHTQYSRVSGRLVPPLLRVNVERRRLRLDACSRQLVSALKTYRLTHLTRIARARDRITGLAERAERATWTLLDSRAASLEHTGQLLAAFSYRGVLSRGFALVRDGGGTPLRTAAAVQPGTPLDIEFTDGRVGATAHGVSKRIESPPFARPRPRARRGGGGGGEGQGSLFG